MDIKISIKSMGQYFMIPLLINDVLLPFVILLIKTYGSKYNLDQGVYLLNQMFVPFLAGFWVFLHMTKYIDAKGNECYYIAKRNKLPDVLKLFVLYILLNTPFFIWYCSLDAKYFMEWVHIVIMSFVFVSAAYCGCYVFKSISLALIFPFLYLVASVTGLSSVLNKYSFYEYDGMSGGQLLNKYKIFMIVAILFLIIGNKLNHRYEDYNL